MLIRNRKSDREPRTFIDIFSDNGAVHILDNVVTYRQPYARTFAHVFCCVERLEDAGQNIVGDSPAGILRCNVNTFIVFKYPQCNLRLCISFSHGVSGIAEQVQDHLFDVNGMAQNRSTVLGKLGHDLNSI
ncbi:MAG: hypothetical protein ACI8PT_000226 [Gammaproteobacteria bacterium]|jgi:hypothetical protein